MYFIVVVLRKMIKSTDHFSLSPTYLLLTVGVIVEERETSKARLGTGLEESRRTQVVFSSSFTTTVLRGSRFRFDSIDLLQSTLRRPAVRRVRARGR